MSPKIALGKKPVKKTDAVCIVKTVICILLFLAAMAAFTYACRDMVDHFMWLLSPSLKTTVPWLIRVSVYAFLLGIMTGIVTVLVRPLWLTLMTYLMASLLFPLIVGTGTVTWIMAGVFALVLLLYLMSVARQMKNQIHFSLHPLSDRKILLFLVLTVIVSVAVAMSYTKDASARTYIVPPEIKKPIVELMVNQMKPLVMQQAASATVEQIDAAMQELQGKMQSFADNMEQKIKPYPRAIATVFGVLFFSVLSIVFFILAFLLIPTLALILFLLRVTGFAHTTTEMREVKHLTLESL